MIREIATIQIDPSRAEAFEAAVTEAEAHFRASLNCLEFSLHRGIENEREYRLIVGWTSVEAHMVDFRGSPGFAAWRTLASPFFVTPPLVEHVTQVIPRVSE